MHFLAAGVFYAQVNFSWVPSVRFAVYSRRLIKQLFMWKEGVDPHSQAIPHFQYNLPLALHYPSVSFCACFALQQYSLKWMGLIPLIGEIFQLLYPLEEMHLPLPNSLLSQYWLLHWPHCMHSVTSKAIFTLLPWLQCNDDLGNLICLFPFHLAITVSEQFLTFLFKCCSGDHWVHKVFFSWLDLIDYRVQEMRSPSSMFWSSVLCAIVMFASVIIFLSFMFVIHNKNPMTSWKDIIWFSHYWKCTSKIVSFQRIEWLYVVYWREWNRVKFSILMMQDLGLLCWQKPFPFPFILAVLDSY